MMEGFDREWNEAGDQRQASYTNLDPGEYRFRVKGSNNDGVWNEEGRSIRLIITPPPWRTWWAYLLYAVAMVSALYGWRRYELNRVDYKHRLELKQVEAEKLQEIDRAKSRFFTDISHEFRTPLTLILGTLEQLTAQMKDHNLGEHYVLMKRNARRLLTLVNQILDLSRMVGGQIAPDLRQQDITAIVRNCVAAFASLAEIRAVNLNLETPHDELGNPASIYAMFDPDLIEKCINNLLSNALKFTPPGGTVQVVVDSITSEDEAANGVKHIGSAFVSISDTGIGIAPDKLERIFDRFYQAHNDDPAEPELRGTGVGLALVQEIVDMHGGEIKVESEVGRGSTFMLSLPESLADIGHRAGRQAAADSSAPAGDRPVVLIVEDNPDMRAYICAALAPTYRIAEAADGEAGLLAAANMVPDLIISDVMMPQMDGFELCRRIKTDERISHIPLILLTARVADGSKISGLEAGADDYLPKPFNARELVVRIGNLIEQRSRLRVRFSREITLQPEDIAITSADEKFLNKIRRTVEAHLSDTGFNMELFAEEIGWSRPQLYRKLKALYDLSPAEFLYEMRLRRAEQLLLKSDQTVTEISMETGFSSPAHFAKRFRKKFGMPPAKYRELQTGHHD